MRSVVGLAALLGPTRAPLAARIGFPVFAAAWLGYLHVFFDPAAAQPQMWLFSAIPLVLTRSRPSALRRRA